MRGFKFWARTVALFSGLLLLVGCGPHIQSIKGDFKTVRVILDDTPPNGLILMSSTGPVSGPSSSSGREMVFKLPTDNPEKSGGCLYLADRSGNQLTDSRGYSGFKNKTWARYMSLMKEVDFDERRLEQNKTLLYKNDYPIFTGECPIIRRHEQPKDACTPSDEEGVAQLICGVSVFGGDFCGLVAEGKAPNILRGALCGVGTGIAVSSALAEEYPIDAQLRDAIIGGMGDFFGKQCEGDGFFSKLFGCGGFILLTGVKLDMMNQCIADRKKLCREQYRKWYELPETLQNTCHEVQQLEKNLPAKKSEFNQVGEMDGQFEFGCRP